MHQRLLGRRRRVRHQRARLQQEIRVLQQLEDGGVEDETTQGMIRDSLFHRLHVLNRLRHT